MKCGETTYSVNCDLSLAAVVASVLGDHEQLVRATLSVSVDENRVLGGVVGHGAGTLHPDIVRLQRCNVYICSGNSSLQVQ